PARLARPPGRALLRAGRREAQACHSPPRRPGGRLVLPAGREAARLARLSDARSRLLRPAGAASVARADPARVLPAGARLARGPPRRRPAPPGRDRRVARGGSRAARGQRLPVARLRCRRLLAERTRRRRSRRTRPRLDARWQSAGAGTADPGRADRGAAPARRRARRRAVAVGPLSARD